MHLIKNIIEAMKSKKFLCVNCKYHHKSTVIGKSKVDICNCDKGRMDIVTGKPESNETLYCYNERSFGFIEALIKNKCGVTGRFYENKNQTQNSAEIKIKE